MPAGERTSCSNLCIVFEKKNLLLVLLLQRLLLLLSFHGPATTDTRLISLTVLSCGSFIIGFIMQRRSPAEEERVVPHPHRHFKLSLKPSVPKVYEFSKGLGVFGLSGLRQSWRTFSVSRRGRKPLTVALWGREGEGDTARRHWKAHWWLWGAKR